MSKSRNKVTTGSQSLFKGMIFKNNGKFENKEGRYKSLAKIEVSFILNVMKLSVLED